MLRTNSRESVIPAGWAGLQGQAPAATQAGLQASCACWRHWACLLWAGGYGHQARLPLCPFHVALPGVLWPRQGIRCPRLTVRWPTGTQETHHMHSRTAPISQLLRSRLSGTDFYCCTMLHGPSASQGGHSCQKKQSHQEKSFLCKAVDTDMDGKDCASRTGTMKLFHCLASAPAVQSPLLADCL